MSSIRGQNIREQRVVIVGGGAVGKSTLTVRFVAKQFTDGYDPTIEDSYRKHCVVNNEAVLLDILDTAGQEEYGAMREQWYRHGDGFILVFSITSRESFEEMTGMHQQILRVKDVDFVPCVIVANKSDLEAQRQVGVLEARTLAKQLGCPLVEASAKEGINVDVAFFELVKLIRKDQKKVKRTTTLPSKEEEKAAKKADKKGKKQGRRMKGDHHCGCILA